MHGNVWEWCLDDDRPEAFFSRTQAAPADGSAYIMAESASKIKGIATKRMRGGSWTLFARSEAVSSGAYFNAAPVLAANEIGFRVVLAVDCSVTGATDDKAAEATGGKGPSKKD